MLRRVPAGGDQPQDSGHHLGCEHVLLGARQEIPQRLGRGEGEDVRDGIPDGGGAPREPSRDRGLGHPFQARPREGAVHTAVGAPGGEHRHGEELPVAVQRHQRNGPEVRHGDTVLLPSTLAKTTRGQRVQAGQAGHPPRAAGIPRLQLPPDERLRGGERQRHAAGGEQLLQERGASVPCRVHQDLDREARGPRQGLLHPRRHRRALAAAGRGHGRGDEQERGRWDPRAGLHRRERLDEGRQAHSVVHRGRQQDGMEEILTKI